MFYRFRFSVVIKKIVFCWFFLFQLLQLTSNFSLSFILSNCLLHELIFPVLRLNMPRSYVRKTTRSYNDSDIEMALFLVNEGGYGARCVARSTGVPLSTLKRKLKNDGCLKKVFSDSQEKSMAEEIRGWCSQRKRALKQILGYAFCKAIISELKFPMSWAKSREAGVEWWRGFKERNLKSELQSFEPLRCSVCNVSIKLSRADFLECLKCSQFVCASCLLLPDKTMCKKC